MTPFIFPVFLLLVALTAFAVSALPSGVRAELQASRRRTMRAVSFVSLALALIFTATSMFTIVPPSTVGVVTTFGKIDAKTLAEGGHFIAPWQKVHKVPVGMDVAEATKSQAGSRDLQSVHADLTVNYHVDPAKARELFALNPALGYEEAFVVPAIYEVFKAVVARYTAEELITKRQEVSDSISSALNSRLQQYHLQVQTVNLVNFGFSRSFDAAIEEKVTASQKAETAKRNLERVKFEADARIAQADGEAKAIAIQSAAVEKSGGAGYVQLQAIAKWDGKLPTTMAGGAVPFVNLK